MSEWALPAWIHPNLWQEFEEHRKEIKKPLTNRARMIAARKLQGLSYEDQRLTIETTIECRWTGLFPQHHETHNRALRQESASARASRIWRERNGHG